MSKTIVVTYEFKIMIEGDEIVEKVRYDFNSTMYDDQETTDAMVIGLFMQDMKKKYGDNAILKDVVIDREIKEVH